MWHSPLLRAFTWFRAGLDWGKYRADLGETLDESIARWGAVKHIGDIRSYYPQHEFECDGMDVAISYENGRAIRVWHSAERAIPGEVIEAGLAAYGLGQEWTVLAEVPDKVAGLFAVAGTHYQRADGEAWASVGARGRDVNQRVFHFDIVCGRWARVHPTRYGVWRANSRPTMRQVDDESC